MRIAKLVLQEDNNRQIFRKTNISYPLVRTDVSGGKKCLFLRKFGVLCFLVTPVLGFALLPYYRRIMLFFRGKLIVGSSDLGT